MNSESTQSVAQQKNLNNTLIVIQARTNSARFPGKVLIDFLGIPLAVLVAKRAGLCGHQVVLATSDENSDDALAETSERHGVKCIRGPLNDVLGRFLLALKDRDDDEIVVRLTADNVVPDGDLISEVVADFVARGLDYITTTDSTSGLPYGCSVEVTRARHLRQAAIEAQTDFEREHVTTWIRAQSEIAVFTRHASISRAHFRCTIDCLDDYTSLIEVFPRDCDPYNVSWRVLVDSLVPGKSQPVISKPVEKLVLGTAQLGMPYGIVRSHVPDSAQSAQMIKQAITNGVSWLDTARSYGRSEEVIGQALSTGWNGRSKIVTKLSPLSDCPEDADPKMAATMAENSLRSSCMALGRSKLDTLLLHRASHLNQWDGHVFAVLKQWRSEGLLSAIGVSVQTPEELNLALDWEDVEHIQLPFNVVDHRWSTQVEKLSRIRQERNIVVHARSVFLQGLLLNDDSKAWARAHIADAAPVRSWLSEQAEGMGYPDIASFCLAYVRSQNWVDGLVVGCDNLTQLHEAIIAFDQRLMTETQALSISQDRPKLVNISLDPSQWLPE